MHFFSTDLVRPLALAENNFLEILLTNFVLTRRSRQGGVELTVAFDSETPALWNRDGRDMVRRRMAAHLDSFSKAYQAKLDAILIHGKIGSFSPDDPEFVWRWASAGTLPIITIGSNDYYCLFYRDVFPIGWNIANGACDNRSELLDPLQALERELGEELVVLSPDAGIRYVLQHSGDINLDRAEFGNFRRMWHEQFPRLEMLSYETEGLALKWEHGPDRVSVRSDDGVHEIADCFVNITSADFGIELDRIARIAVVEGAVLCDGETNRGRVLNRPVGLFEVDRLRSQISSGATTFVPDRFFHSGVAYGGHEFQRVLQDRLTPDIMSRSPAIATAFANADEKLNLCPVTSSIVRRHHASRA
jgi:hypothetical protein